MEEFTKSKAPPWVFFTFLKLYKWYQITQSITFYMQRDRFAKIQFRFQDLACHRFC